MQLTLQKKRKCHFFADYFGKHFHSDLKKAGEYVIEKTILEIFPRQIYRGQPLLRIYGGLVINVQRMGHCIICAFSTTIGKNNLGSPR